MNYKSALIGLALCTSAALRASPTPLFASDNLDFATIPDHITPTGFQHFQSDGYVVGALTGSVGVTVYNDPNNVLGGMTFVYDISNLPADPLPNDGVISFTVSGWQGYKTSFDLGDYIGTPPGGTVGPASAIRSGDGNDITFTFPFIPENLPPIFAGQESFLIFLYTDATTWGSASANVESAQFAFGPSNNTPFLSVGAAGGPVGSSVPDDSSTALLAVIGIALAGVSAGFRKRNKA